jgi:hypothetical protein
MTKIKDWEDRLDKINGEYGDKESYCIFCKSREYNGQVGIVHTEECIIQEMRDIIKNEQKVCKWLHADWCHCPKYKEQEKCNFYFENYLCEDFKERTKSL